MVDIYICIYMKCLCRWNAKNKKKLNFCLFAEGNDQGPRQRRVLCRGPSHCPRQRFFFKKNKISTTFLCRGPWLEALGKDFFKKNKISLPRACVEALDKDFFKKKNNSLLRAVPLPSAKIFWKNSAHVFAEG